MGQQQAAKGSSLLADGFAWSLNVVSAVAIVFVNKVLMRGKGGYGFSFACTLSAIHFLTAAAWTTGTQLLGLQERASHVPWKAAWGFSVVAVVSIGSLNLSLLLNPVGLYQVAKLLVIPFLCGVEAVWLQRRFNTATLLSVATVILGVATVTVTDLGSGATHTLGVILAGVSVVASGMQQFLCGHLQKVLRLQSHQLLSATAPIQGGMLLVMGPWVDAAVSGNWIGDYTLTSPALGVLLASCVLSVGINVSQFMCLGRFSAVTFQVLGHTKTILVLLISWLALGEPMSLRKLFGMSIAVAGMIGYGYFVNSGSSSSSSSSSAARASKPSGSSNSSSSSSDKEAGLTAKEAAQAGKPAGNGDTDEDDSDAVPLLRNVTRDHGWAGENVMVVAVERKHSDTR